MRDFAAILIENDEIHAHQGLRNTSGFPVALFLLQNIDQIDRRLEAYALAFRGNAGHRNRRAQVCLAGAGTANEHCVLRRIGELLCRQLPDQVLVLGVRRCRRTLCHQIRPGTDHAVQA